MKALAPVLAAILLLAAAMSVRARTPPEGLV